MVPCVTTSREGIAAIVTPPRSRVTRRGCGCAKRWPVNREQADGRGRQQHQGGDQQAEVKTGPERVLRRLDHLRDERFVPGGRGIVHGRRAARHAPVRHGFDDQRLEVRRDPELPEPRDQVARQLGVDDRRVESDLAAIKPLGLFEEIPLEQETVQLQPGDWVIVFSDGVSEALSASGEEFSASETALRIDSSRSGFRCWVLGFGAPTR